MKLGAVAMLLVWAIPLAGQGIGGLGGFGGPSILGRGGGGGGQRQRDGLRIRPYVGVQAVYDSGLTSISPGAGGAIYTRGAAGVEILGGLYGSKEWKRNQLRMSYSGDYRHYSTNTGFNGSDQSLSLNYSRVLTKRVGFEGSLTAGTTNRAFGGPSQFGVSDGITQPLLPLYSLFDVRTNYGGANATLSYNINPRTSLNFSGGGYVVKRQNTAVFGLSGLQARADLARRIGRRTTIGVDYSFVTFQFSRAFGDTYIHGLGGYIAQRFGRYWELNLRAGAVRMELLGKRQVQIDPAIAAIIGVTTGEEVSYRVNVLGSGSAELLRTARSGTIRLMGSRSVSPGNGIILTSQIDLASASFNRRLSRKLNFDLMFSATRMRGIGLITGDIKTVSGGVGLGWQVARHAQITTRFDRRNSSTSSNLNNAYTLNGNRFSVGIIFTPADIPVSLW